MYVCVPVLVEVRSDFGSPGTAVIGGYELLGCGN